MQEKPLYWKLDDLKNLTLDVAKELMNRITLLESEGAKMNREKLRVLRRGMKVYYYAFDGEKTRYIKQKNIRAAKEIAQSDYESTLLKEYKKLAKMLAPAVAYLDPESVLKPYESRMAERRALIDSIDETDRQFVENWLKLDYAPLRIYDENHMFVTNKGDYVRSKSEAIIANALHAANIPYHYEMPIEINGETFYPDFSILDVKNRRVIIWEHFGLMDNPDYINRMIQKSVAYNLGGYSALEGNFITTFECGETPLDTRVIMRIVERLTANLPDEIAEFVA